MASLAGVSRGMVRGRVVMAPAYAAKPAGVKMTFRRARRRPPGLRLALNKRPGPHYMPPIMSQNPPLLRPDLAPSPIFD
ncbi:hypothetical protein, partial [Paracoccus yeei]|uniref:hypothetical protein n=1 Tax=Paracoccus yeei TaxID=147645 RepID=UPI0024305506